MYSPDGSHESQSSLEGKEMNAARRIPLGFALFVYICAAPGWAEDADTSAASEAATATEEIVVTGSYIRGTPEDAALPVDVTTAEDLEEIGNPTVVEMVRNLAYTSGNIGETNQFSASGSGDISGGATINLRGLGSSRTLVIINGHRHVATQSAGVDVAALPTMAIGRLEVLKDGAAALYGSDAIAGVVNVISRAGFEGLEFRASEQFIEDSDGEHEAGFIWGASNDRMNYFISGEWLHRSELRFKDRDWGLLPYATQPQGGWSSIGNPGTIYAAAPALPATGTGIIAAGVPDPQCNPLGGVSAGGFCRFQYTYFDNLIEEQDKYNVFGEVNFDVLDDAKLHFEYLYSKVNVDDWKTSPSYPPQSLFGPDRYIAPNHPGLVDFKAKNPGFFIDRLGIPAASQGAYVWGRMIGVAGLEGKPQTGERETETRRLATSLTGSFADSIDYDVAVSYSERTRRIQGYDMFVERMAFAIDGLGGPGCNPVTGTPGVGACMYFNPFSNAIPVSAANGVGNPTFSAANQNPRALLDWLVGPYGTQEQDELLVWDAVVSGESPFDLGGGPIGWAAGIQARKETYSLNLIDEVDLEKQPCPFSNPQSVTLRNVTQASFDACLSGNATATGPYAFISGTYELDTSNTVYGAFGELALPISDTIDMQIAARFEDYGGEVGSTVDPKIALSWQALDWLKFRASASTTFRGPPQSFLGGRATNLRFITAALAFKAVDTVGNPDLKPEEALATNFGIVLDAGGLYGTVDYWAFDFSDPFQTESFNQLVGAYSAKLCANGQAGAATPDCQILRSHIFPTGTSAALLERIETNVINGSDIKTSGVDAYVQYTFEDVFDGELTFGAQGTYTLEYDSKDFKEINGLVMAQGGDFAGLINDGTSPFTSLPEFKGDAFVKFEYDRHRFTYVARYVSEYHDDDRTAVIRDIDDHLTHDVHYILGLMDDALTLSASVVNIADEDPPRTATDLNYDPVTHNAFGRMVKVGFKYHLGGL
jgi:outer membrane receptor protein involved in Fe transport